MEQFFIRPLNITVDRFIFFSLKQKKGKSVEKNYKILKGIMKNCNCADCEGTVIKKRMYN